MQSMAKNIHGESFASSVELAALAKALAHPARIKIVQLLMAKKSCIGGDIVDEIGLAQSTVSEHLRILKSVGIIIGEIERPRVCYSLDPDRLLPLTSFLNLAFDSDRQNDADASSCWISPNIKSKKS